MELIYLLTQIKLHLLIQKIILDALVKQFGHNSCISGIYEPTALIKAPFFTKFPLSTGCFDGVAKTITSALSMASSDDSTATYFSIIFT